ncbi:hypothetical protein GCM10023191_024840 [Actinoallomurus oryzae]|uniref:Uncharacterized protein n=1 Tax=Actinoallomurus oryzae TaxID=502180 RepID=A0ABP8PTG0_9ACTN
MTDLRDIPEAPAEPAAVPPVSPLREVVRPPGHPRPALQAPAVLLEQVTKVYPRGVRALTEVSITVERGTFVVVTGPPGAGKSALLHCAAGLDEPTSGNVIIDGTAAGGLSETRRAELRRERVGFVFAPYNLVPSLTVADNIRLPLRLVGKEPDRDWLRMLVERVGLSDRLDHRPAELSDGRQRRAMIARALVTRPTVVFGDEPTGGLDPHTAGEVLDLLRDLVDGLGQTMVMVTRDPAVAAWADRALVMAGGRVRGTVNGPTAAGGAHRLTELETEAMPGSRWRPPPSAAGIATRPAPDPGTAQAHGSMFGALLRAHRTRLGLSQEKLSAESGMSVRAISDMERGRARGPQSRSTEVLGTALRLSRPELDWFHQIATAGRRRSNAFDRTLDSLPAHSGPLAGRDGEIATIRALADTAAHIQPPAPPAAAISGGPGVGKTALAIRAAYDLRDRFPDGQLFVCLGSAGRRSGSPAGALGTLLRSLGVSGELPTSLQERGAMYRSLLTGKRVLVVLDDAIDERQVRPLIAPNPHCMTLVTSRRTLAGLETARPVPLRCLSVGEALTLLEQAVGADRVAAEPEASAELVQLCGLLPLALQIMARRLANRPGLSIRRLVEQLRPAENRLTALSVDDLNVRDAFVSSYRRLSPTTQRIFRCLSLLPDHRPFDAGLAAASAGVGRDRTEEALEELIDTNLVEVTRSVRWFQLPGLLWLFARERQEEEGQEESVGGPMRFDGRPLRSRHLQVVRGEQP